MKRILITGAAASLLALAPALASAATTATIAWDSFTVTLFDLDPLDGVAPSITWADQYSEVYTTDGIFDTAYDFTDSWDPVSVADGVANASANGHMTASVAPTAGATAEAGVFRLASFELSAGTLALFTVNASYALDPSAIAGEADMWMSAYGPGASGSGDQDNGSELWTSLGISPMADSSVLSATFANTSDTALTGSFEAYAFAAATAPVPEPGSYAMFLAGLGLLGAVARRRV